MSALGRVGLTVLVVVVSVFVVDHVTLSGRLARARTRSDSLAAALVKAEAATAVALTEQRRLSARADIVSRRAAPIRYVVDSLSTSVVVDSTPIIRDTTAFVTVQRPSVDVQPIAVPKFLVDQRNQLIKDARTLDSAWRAEQMARLYADSTTIPTLQQEAKTAKGLAASRADEITVLERKVRLWKVGGLVLAVAGLVLAIVQ